MAYAADLKSAVREDVRVRVPEGLPRHAATASVRTILPRHMPGGSQRVEGVRALVLLAVAGASTFYAVAMATTFSLVKLAATNDVSPSYRRRVLFAVVVGALVPITAGLVYA